MRTSDSRSSPSVGKASPSFSSIYIRTELEPRVRSSLNSVIMVPWLDKGTLNRPLICPAMASLTSGVSFPNMGIMGRIFFSNSSVDMMVAKSQALFKDTIRTSGSLSVRKSLKYYMSVSFVK